MLHNVSSGYNRNHLLSIQLKRYELMGSNEKSTRFLSSELSQNASKVVNILLNIALVASIFYGAYTIVMLFNQESFSFIKAATIAAGMGTNIYILISLRKMNIKEKSEIKDEGFTLGLD
jgi:hypothetical protein